MVRLQIQCPPPAGCLPRSGPLIIDFHGVKITTGSMPPAQRQGARFEGVNLSGTSSTPNNFDENFLMEVKIQRLLVACSAAHQRMATSILSLGPLHPSITGGRESQSFGMDESLPALQPQLSIAKLMSHSKESPSVTVLSFNIPFVQVDLFKPVLDSLQFWADDVSQLIDGYGVDKAQFKNSGQLTEARNASASKNARSSETVVKIAISDGIFFVLCSFPADEAFNSIC
jgi:autophagy-related protein 2